MVRPMRAQCLEGQFWGYKMSGLLLTEPIAIEDTYVTGLAEAEDLGDGTYRMTFFVKRRSTYDIVGETEYLVAERLIMPMPAMIDAMRKTMRALGLNCCGAKKLLMN